MHSAGLDHLFHQLSFEGFNVVHIAQCLIIYSMDVEHPCAHEEEGHSNALCRQHLTLISDK